MKKQILWIIEAVVWLLIIGVIVFIISFINVSNTKHNETYHVFLEDVDGLIIGSPVRMMGLQIGYVSDIKIVENKIFITFVVSQDNTKIPENSIITVGAYGLAGSKSLEIYPDSKGEKPYDYAYFIPKSPRRIGDVYKVQADINQSIINISVAIGKEISVARLPMLKSLLKQSDNVNMAIEKNNEIIKTEDKLIKKLNDIHKNQQEKNKNKEKK